jgi:hypothetical protein
LNDLFNDALKTAHFILALGEEYKDMGYQVFKVLSRTIFGTGQRRQQIKSVGGKRTTKESTKCFM